MQMYDMKQIEFQNVNLLMVLSINFEAVNWGNEKDHSAHQEKTESKKKTSIASTYVNYMGAKVIFFS